MKLQLHACYPGCRSELQPLQSINVTFNQRTVDPGGNTLRKISFSTNVHAPFETIWKIMLDRIEHPSDLYMKEVRIIERQDNLVVREVRARWQLITERINIDKAKREIRYTIQEHPLASGSATLRAVPLSRQSPVAPVHLSMVLDWTPKTEEAEQKILETIPREVQQELEGIRDEAEGRGSNGSG